MRKRNQTLALGSYSSGTMRAEDLGPTFLDALAEVDPRRARKLRKEWDAISDEQDNADEQRGYIVDELFDVLGEYTPEYCHFSSHDGDGALYGVWISHDVIEDDVRCGDLLKVDGVGDIPSDYYGNVLVVSDHGNMTLYRRAKNNRLIEVWSVV